MTPYDAAHERAGFRRRHERGIVRVTGADRLAWLQGLLTNDVSFSGAGVCYAAWLTPQGRMITDMTVVETGRETWLDVPSALARALTQKLDLLIFTEDARVEDASSRIVSVGVYGPQAGVALRSALPEIGDADPAGTPAIAHGEAGQVVVTKALQAGAQGFHAYLPWGRAAGFEEALSHNGAMAIDDETAEVLRVEAGVPRFLVDMNEETIPFEAGLDAALSHTKGCYVGQEIIVRIRDRAHGRVARRLMGLLPEGPGVPVADDPVRVDDRQVGRVTSAVFSPALERPIALAMIHRDQAEPGTVVTLPGGRPATVTSLPFTVSDTVKSRSSS